MTNKSRNLPFTKFTLTNERKDEILSNLSILSSQSTYLDQMSNDEKLEIIREIKTQIRLKQWHYSFDEKVNSGSSTTTKSNKTPFGDYEAALLQMSPMPCQGKKIVDSFQVKKYKAWSRFLITFFGISALEMYEDHIYYLMHKQYNSKSGSGSGSGAGWNTPKLLSNIQPLFKDTDEAIASGNEQFYIHGRESIPIDPADFEVWTKSDQRNDLNQEEAKQLIVSSYDFF